MQIKTIHAANFKGATFDTPLTPITLIHGRNFAGKSSRVQALTLALLGYVPGIARTGKALHTALASYDLMVAAVTTDTGLRIERKYEMRRGSVTVTEPTASGDDRSLEPVSLDASAYFALSGPARSRFLFERAKLPPEMQQSAVMATIISNIKNIRVENNTEASESVIADLVTLITESEANSDGTQDFISNTATALGERRKLAVANAQRQEKTLQGLSQNTDLANYPPNAEALLQAASEALINAQTQQARVTLSGKDARRALDDATRLAATAVDEQEARDRLEQLSAKKESIFKACQSKPNIDASKVALESARAAMTEASLAIRQADADLDRTRHELANTRAERTCSKCGQSVVKLKEKLVAAIEEKVADLTLKAVSVRERFEAATLALKTAAAAADADLERLNEWMANSESFRQISREHAELQDKLESTAAAQAAKAKLPELQKALEDVTAEWTEWNNRVKAAREAVTLATEDNNKLIAQRTNDQLRAATRIEQDRARAEVEVLKQATAGIAELQTKLVNATIGPLVQTANALCDGILRAPLEYKDGEIGMTNPGTGAFVPHNSFSGTEQALTYAAISVALASLMGDLRMVILDEMGRLDAGNKEAVCDNLLDLYRNGKIDQAILIDTEPMNWGALEFSAVHLK